MRWITTGVLVVALAGVAFVVASNGDSSPEIVALNGQGGGDLRLDQAVASLERTDNRLVLQIKAQTPAPGSYEYPTGEMIPPWGTPHPEVVPMEPEVFTMWIVVINRPELCTDECDADDLEPGAAAEGGLYLGDGRIVDSDQIVMRGDVTTGQEPLRGAALEFPHGAEVHVALAPHGMAHTGADLARQLTGPVGNPSLWWGAGFVVPGSDG